MPVNRIKTEDAAHTHTHTHAPRETRAPRLLIDVRLDPVGEGSPTSAASGPALAAAAEPAASRRAPRAPTRPGRGMLRRNLPLAVIFLVLGAITLAGLEYYRLPPDLRVRHDYHAWFKPSGYVGQSAGVVACLMFLFMFLYPLRKRMRRRPWLGSLPRWLDVHIACGLAVPVVAAIHAGWRFQGLIGLGYLAMLLVSLSGIVGRYLYVHIPRSRAGVELSMDELEQRRVALTDEVARKAGLDSAEVEAVTSAISQRRGPRGLLATVGALIAGDLLRFRAMSKLRRRWGKQCRLDKPALREVMGLVRRQVALTQQRRMLEATQRVFRFWHVVHRPFSISAFIAVTIHVAVVVAMGVTWFW